MNAPIIKAAPASAFSDERVRRRLWAVLIVYETLVIAIVAGAGLNIALMAGGSVPMAAPLALIACAEALRIPLSAMAVRLRWPGRLLAALALLAIAIGSAEGLAVAFEAFLQNRVVEISHAAADVEKLEHDQAAHAADVASLAGEVKDIDAQVATLARSMPTPPAGSNRTCTWRGQRVSCSADAAAIAAYREALKAYDVRLASLTDRRGALQGKVDAARAERPPAGLLEARRAFEEKAGQNPVWRLTAAVFGESVSEVTPAQFATVKKFVTASLAIAFATLSMVVSVVVHARLRSEGGGKLARAIRGYLARRRRQLIRMVPGPVEFRDRIVVKWVPFDPKSGLRIKPDGEPADVVSPTWAKTS
jgi:hypothetical protein